MQVTYINTEKKDDLYRLVYTLLFMKFSPSENIKGILTPNFIEKGMILIVRIDDSSNLIYSFIEKENTDHINTFKNEKDALKFIEKCFNVSYEKSLKGDYIKAETKSAFSITEDSGTKYVNEFNNEDFIDSIIYGIKGNLKKYKFKKPISELNLGVVKMQISRIKKELREGEQIFNNNLPL